MSQDTNKLTSMVKEAPDQVEGLGKGIDAIQDEMDSLQSEINGITNGVCGTTKADLIDYLENVKMPAVGGDTVTYGPTFGSIVYPTGNIDDWTIDSTGVPIYEYLGVGWDSDTSITTWIQDYAFGNDYLTRPIEIGSTYGLQGNFNLASAGKSTLQANQAKVDASITVLSRYAT